MPWAETTISITQKDTLAAMIDLGNFVVFDVTWKVQFFRAKKDFLKQRCAQNGMWPAFLAWGKGREYLYFWQILLISWNTIHDTAAIFVYMKAHTKNEEVKQLEPWK